MTEETADPASNFRPLRAASIAAGAAGAHDSDSGGVIPAWQPSTTFLRRADQSLISGRIYARDDAPNLAQAEAVIARLEGAQRARLFASGMAAASALIRSGGPSLRVLVQNVGYYKLVDWIARQHARKALSAAFFNPRDSEDLERQIIAFKPDLVWIETPANPLMTVVDIARAAQLAHAHRAELAVDSSVATPVLTRPLDHGADYVFHSVTKGLNGHSDVLGGAIVCNETARLWPDLRIERNYAGAQMSSFDAWLLMRGMRTLGLRVERSSFNALAIAQFLTSRPEVSEVFYPGMPGFPGFAIASRQMRNGFGPLLSFRMRAQSGRSGQERALALAAKVRLFQRATSLGGVESLIEHRASVEGVNPIAPEDLLRISAGIEDIGDLLDDLIQALDDIG